jgi:GntR family transcriptional regulator of vanillate catabolism
VRLALERLAHEGLLEALPTTGFRVRVFTPTDVQDAIEVRGVLEGTAARLAAERLSDPAELDALRTSCRETAALLPMTVDRFVRYLDLNESFHRELWRLAKSPVLIRALEAAVALPFAAPGALVFGETESEQGTVQAMIAIEHHRAIVEAIENREGTRAESLAREHSRVARSNLERALREPRSSSPVPGASFVRLSRQSSTGNQVRKP